MSDLFDPSNVQRWRAGTFGGSEIVVDASEFDKAIAEIDRQTVVIASLQQALEVERGGK